MKIDIREVRSQLKYSAIDDRMSHTLNLSTKVYEEFAAYCNKENLPISHTIEYLIDSALVQGSLNTRDLMAYKKVRAPDREKRSVRMSAAYKKRLYIHCKPGAPWYLAVEYLMSAFINAYRRQTLP